MSIKQKKIIVFLCSQLEETRERKGYANAFRYLGFTIVYCENAKATTLYLEMFHNDVFCIIHPDPVNSFHCAEIWSYPIVNIIFQFDTYTLPKIRAKASLPYDVQVVCHPGYEKYYTNLGAKNVWLLPHCIDNILLQQVNVTQKKLSHRCWDIGWIGRSDAHFYQIRRNVLQTLKKEKLFLINETERNYSWNEMFEIFSDSKIVVNVSRDDFSIDANLRCFEAMGLGALLITKLPTELTKIGFKEGEHFVGIDDYAGITEVVKECLKSVSTFEEIAMNGQRATLLDHTYLARVTTIVEILKDKYATILDSNKYRTASDKKKNYYLAYSYFKDFNVVSFFNSFFKSGFYYGALLLDKVIIISLKKIKAQF